ncbi:MAG: L-rhamnose mutarotase [Alphaproteobacteria bacterium]
MIKKASIMQLKKGFELEYKRRHDEIWEDLVQILKEHGVHNYSIFLYEATGQLFAYLEIESQKKWDAIAQTEVCQRWWKYMADIMEANSDNSPTSIELPSVFYLE